MKIVIMILSISSVLGGCSYLNKKLGLKDDHLAEQIFEFYLEKEAGIKIDLSK